MIIQYFLNREIITTSEEHLKDYLNRYVQVWDGSKWINTSEKIYSIIEKREILSVSDIMEKFGVSYFGQTKKGYMVALSQHFKRELLIEMIDFIYSNNTNIVNTKTHLPYKTAAGAKKYLLK